jgi:hypothetical protein
MSIAADDKAVRLRGLDEVRTALLLSVLAEAECAARWHKEANHSSDLYHQTMEARGRFHTAFEHYRDTFEQCLLWGDVT